MSDQRTSDGCPGTWVGKPCVREGGHDGECQNADDVRVTAEALRSLTCTGCDAHSPAVPEDAVIDAAVDAGWEAAGHNEEDRDLCPACQGDPRSASASAPLMTLDEAIEHATEKSKRNDACGREHALLASWLIDLRERRSASASPCEIDSLRAQVGELLEGQKALIDANGELAAEVARLIAEAALCVLHDGVRSEPATGSASTDSLREFVERLANRDHAEGCGVYAAHETRMENCTCIVKPAVEALRCASPEKTSGTAVPKVEPDIHEQTGARSGGVEQSPVEIPRPLQKAAEPRPSSSQVTESLSGSSSGRQGEGARDVSGPSSGPDYDRSHAWLDEHVHDPPTPDKVRSLGRLLADVRRVTIEEIATMLEREGRPGTMSEQHAEDRAARVRALHTKRKEGGSDGS